MKWPTAHKTIFDSIKKKFSFLPVRIKDEQFWFCRYYEYVEVGPGGAILTVRFSTWEEVAEWLTKYRT